MHRRAGSAHDTSLRRRRVTPEETRKIVAAVCAADDVERSNAGKEAAERVANVVTAQFEDLRDRRDFAYRLIDEVLADANSKDKHDAAKQLREEVSKRWDSITNMSENAMKGGNHPLVAFLSRQGQEEHANRQRDCDAYEVETGSRIADCVMATGETCLVIELKPDNSRAISSGRDQLRTQVAELNAELQKKDSSIIAKMVSKKSDLAKCKKFEGRIDCYKLCPSIDEDAAFREIRADWRKDCS